MIVGAFVGIVFSIIFVALPAAGLLLAINSFSLGWNTGWVPTAPTIMALGALTGGLFSGGLFIKDQLIPYVEEVPDFEDNDDPGTDLRP